LDNHGESIEKVINRINLSIIADEEVISFHTIHVIDSIVFSIPAIFL
jgi:hypothetical protein